MDDHNQSENAESSEIENSEKPENDVSPEDSAPPPVPSGSEASVSEDQQQAPPPVPPNGQPPAVYQQQPLSESDERNFGMLLHVLTIVGGFVAPLIFWLVYRERSSFLDRHGKEALNFQLTMLIGYVASAVLMMVCVGYFTYLVVFVVAIIFAIIAGIEASKGNEYRYPMTIRFIT
ncbi:MAG: DUF4870 domain-containing protein [Verrucomicrobiota bacterium]